MAASAIYTSPIGEIPKRCFEQAKPGCGSGPMSMLSSLCSSLCTQGRHIYSGSLCSLEKWPVLLPLSHPSSPQHTFLKMTALNGNHGKKFEGMIVLFVSRLQKKKVAKTDSVAEQKNKTWYETQSSGHKLGLGICQLPKEG